MKPDTDKAQAMSLNIEQERREFCNQLREKSEISYVKNSTDEEIMSHCGEWFTEGWLPAKIAAAQKEKVSHD